MSQSAVQNTAGEMKLKKRDKLGLKADDWQYGRMTDVDGGSQIRGLSSVTLVLTAFLKGTLINVKIGHTIIRHWFGMSISPVKIEAYV